MPEKNASDEIRKTMSILVERTKILDDDLKDNITPKELLEIIRDGKLPESGGLKLLGNPKTDGENYDDEKFGKIINFRCQYPKLDKDYDDKG